MFFPQHGIYIHAGTIFVSWQLCHIEDTLLFHELVHWIRRDLYCSLDIGKEVWVSWFSFCQEFVLLFALNAHLRQKVHDVLFLCAFQELPKKFKLWDILSILISVTPVWTFLYCFWKILNKYVGPWLCLFQIILLIVILYTEDIFIMVMTTQGQPNKMHLTQKKNIYIYIQTKLVIKELTLFTESGLRPTQCMCLSVCASDRAIQHSREQHL